MVERIISGGQTGADRGGLDAAIALGIPHGGKCPARRRAEDGVIPAIYQLEETTSRNYLVRTHMNVFDADGTVVFTRGAPEGGSAATVLLARRLAKPCLLVDLDDIANLGPVEAARLLGWLEHHQIKTLNVAGSRESGAPGIHDVVLAFLLEALKVR